MENNEQKKELLKQLADKTEKKYQARKKFIIGVVIGVVSLLADGLYHIVLFVTEKNSRERRAGAEKMMKFLDAVFRKQFYLGLILFVLVGIVALIIAIQGLVRWLNFHSQIKKIEVELANLEK